MIWLLSAFLLIFACLSLTLPSVLTAAYPIEFIRIFIAQLKSFQKPTRNFQLLCLTHHIHLSLYRYHRSASKQKKEKPICYWYGFFLSPLVFFLFPLLRLLTENKKNLYSWAHMANKYLSKINKLIEIDSLNARVFFFIVYTLLACLVAFLRILRD